MERVLALLPPLGRALRSWERRGRELHHVHRQADSLVTRSEQLTEQMEAVQSKLDSLGRHMEELQRDVDRRLRATQGLAARIYEAPCDWSSQVQAMRLEESYDRAWSPEPLITVRIATYNNASILVERALASVLRQSYQNWEAVVIGDGCTDDTEQRIAALGDDRIHFENRALRGPYPVDETAKWYTAGIPAMNRALELAHGAWIAPLDHDDEWDRDHLEVLLAEAQRTRAEIVYGKWRMVDASNGRLIAYEFGDVFPPVEGAVAFQAAICHGHLARFRYDMNAYLADEPGDRNLGRRLFEAGVRFAFLDRAVVTYWFTPRADWGRSWLKDIREIYGYADE